MGENRSVKIYPKECRERHKTYSGKISIKVDYFHDGKLITSLEKIVGQVPIMVKVRKQFLGLLQLNETSINSINELYVVCYLNYPALNFRPNLLTFYKKLNSFVFNLSKYF